MANNLYTNLIATVSPYIGQEKAVGAIGRQLLRCRATPETVTVEDLRGIFHFVVGATTLYLAPDRVKQQALIEKLKSLV